MSSQVEQAALTSAYIAQQRLLAASLSRDLVLLVRQIFNIADPGQSWPAMKVSLDTLIRERRRQSAGLAARYYVDLRRAAVPQPLGQANLPEVGAPVVDVRTGLLRTAPRPAPTALPGSPDLPAAEIAPALEPAPATEPALEISEADAWAELERIAGVEPADIEDLAEARVEANLNSTGIASYQKAIRAGQTPEKALDTMAVNLTGSASTLALEGGRELIHEATLGDDDAIGWARVTDADPCAFCAMLASRGAVYHSAGTAGRAKDKQFTGEGMFKYHNHDGCTAVPVFDPNDPVLEEADRLYDKWLEVTRAAPGESMISAWTKYWDNREEKPRPEAAAG